ncbi:hypothetical protein BG61_35365 [Caballeronia glathei]|uniref:Uncharacterized protein n=1 Tax=Caballeronia glathei TaxID=60547 RepID=A0A069PEJ6_9BURK|nr:hypothetical protein BG61_35365 [Caballeronia glathei]
MHASAFDATFAFSFFLGLDQAAMGFSDYGKSCFLYYINAVRSVKQRSADVLENARLFLSAYPMVTTLAVMEWRGHAGDCRYRRTRLSFKPSFQFRNLHELFL